MPELSTLLLFTLAAFVLIAVPGPNLIYIVTRSLGEGRRAGLVSALGVETGTLVHVGVAAVGLSALLASSAIAFGTVKYLGAAYLVYLGLRALLGSEHAAVGSGLQPSPRPTLVFRQALLVQLLNPKVALFFLAFLPQFVDPSRGPAAVQIVMLGAVLALLGLAIDSGYAMAAGAARRHIRSRAGFPRRSRQFSGLVYLALGATAALTGDGPSR